MDVFFFRIRDMTQEQILTDNNMFTLKVKFFFMKNDKTNYQMWFVLF